MSVFMLTPDLPTVRPNYLVVDRDDATITGVTLTGRPGQLDQPGEIGLLAIGESPKNPLRRLKLRDCVLDGFGLYAMLTRFVEGLTLEGCTMQNCYRGGLIVQSSRTVRVDHLTVEEIAAEQDAYGISFQRLVTASLRTADHPPCDDWIVSDSTVRNVLHWHGGDGHSAMNGEWLRCRFMGCYQGLAIGGDTPHAGFPALAPANVRAVNCVVDSQRSDGSASFGICITGIPGGPKAKGCRIVGGSIANHGRQDQPHDAAVYLRDTAGAKVSGTKIYRPSPTGVNCYTNNDRFEVEGVETTDVWTDTAGAVGEAVAAKCSGPGNSGEFKLNSAIRGTLSGKEFILTAGIRKNGDRLGNTVVTTDNTAPAGVKDIE